MVPRKVSKAEDSAATSTPLRGTTLGGPGARGASFSSRAVHDAFWLAPHPRRVYQLQDRDGQVEADLVRANFEERGITFTD